MALPSIRPSLIILACISIGFWSLVIPSRALAQTKPNIILINLDDADAELFELPYSDVMYPNIMKLASDGVSFSNFHVTTPLCGPSRACLYRAQYAHNTGIRVNRPSEETGNGWQGGFRFYRTQGYFQNDLSTWMQSAGYRTMLVGKFLHADFERYIPPGWDDFRSYLGGRYFGTYKFSNESFAAGASTQLPETTYRTVAETNDALELIQNHIDRGVDQPFFLNINPLGPHRATSALPEMIEPRMNNWWPAVTQPFSRAYNEQDISDKGPQYQRPLLNVINLLLNETHYRERALATRSVDDLVGAIRAKVKQVGIENNTYIFLTSDNGFEIGHHRLFGKGRPTDRITRVPCFVVGPNVPNGQVAHQLVAHIDLGPTITKLAGGDIPDFVDGRSFAGLLQPGGIDRFPRFRVGMLVENWASLTIYNNRFNASSSTVRFENEIYTEWANGDREYYDLRLDPEQLNNDYDGLTDTQQQLFAAWLRALRKTSPKTLTTFSAPYQENQVMPANSIIEGMAEHWEGIQQVRVAILDADSRQFWNGQNWDKTLVQLPAELTNRGGQLTQWSYSQMPTQIPGSSGRYLVWAWSYDADGGFGTPAKASFKYEPSR